MIRNVVTGKQEIFGKFSCAVQEGGGNKMGLREKMKRKDHIGRWWCWTFAVHINIIGGYRINIG